LDQCIKLNNPDDMMLLIIETLEETEIIPEVGRYYTFIYKPKTNRIRYDEFPLVAVTNVERWGFRGVNYHWGDFRNYTWQEVQGFLHVVYPLELNDLRSIPYQNFKLNILS
tara:strand:+ start:11497 stop:11829 length:333 start_codon:yes stop_codon:yes gene_type:complete